MRQNQTEELSTENPTGTGHDRQEKSEKLAQTRGGYGDLNTKYMVSWKGSRNKKGY